MCGRYVTVSKLKAIEKRFNVSTENPEQYQINTNVSAGQLAPVISNEDPKQLKFYQFGFTPSWAKKPSYVINARSEGDHNKEDDPNYHGAKGIINKPMFRQSIRSKRCLVIADAFVEGPKNEKLNKPYLVYRRDGERPFAFAGIWDEWVNKETGEILKSFAIITTVSNSVTQAIQHHRSPVILPADCEQLWLDPKLPLGEVTSLLEAFPGAELNAYPISANIKNPRNNGLELLEPKGERISKEHDYVIYNDLKLEGMGHTQARVRKQEREDDGQTSLF